MKHIAACPFCGTTALAADQEEIFGRHDGECLYITREAEGPYDSIVQYVIQCVSCGARGPLSDSPEAALKVWALRFEFPKG